MEFMDLLHKRYASPFPLVDSMIRMEQFGDFVDFLLRKDAEEKEDERLWEFFLHKITDKSFRDFKAGLKTASGTMGVMDEAKKQEIISKSESILNGFVPLDGGRDR